MNTAWAKKTNVRIFTTAQHSLRCRFFYADTTLTTKDIFFFPILYSVMQLLIRNNIVKKKVQKNTAPLSGTLLALRIPDSATIMSRKSLIMSRRLDIIRDIFQFCQHDTALENSENSVLAVIMSSLGDMIIIILALVHLINTGQF